MQCFEVFIQVYVGIKLAGLLWPICFQFPWFNRLGMYQAVYVRRLFEILEFLCNVKYVMGINLVFYNYSVLIIISFFARRYQEI